MMADPRRHARRYAVRFVIGIAAYAVLLVMLLPLPGVLVVAWALWRYLVESDEMVRRDQLVALALAFGLGSVITFTYGLLQLAGAPTLSWLWVWPVYGGCWLLARLLQRLRPDRR